MTALEDCEVCVIPYARLADPGLQRQLHKVMSRELVRAMEEPGTQGLLRARRANSGVRSLSRRPIPTPKVKPQPFED